MHCSYYHFQLGIEDFCSKVLLVLGFFIYLPNVTTNKRTEEVKIVVVYVNGQFFKISRHMKDYTRFYVHHFYFLRSHVTL